MGNEINGFGQFQTEALVVLKGLGYLPADAKEAESFDLTQLAVETWKKDAKNAAAFEFLKAQWNEHGGRIFGTNRIDDLAVEPASMPTVADGSPMTGVADADVYDAPGGKRIGFVRQFFTIKKIGQKDAWYQISYQDFSAEKPETGWVRMQALYPGVLQQGGD